MSLVEQVKLFDDYDVCNTLVGCYTGALTCFLEATPITELTKLHNQDKTKQSAQLVQTILRTLYAGIEFLKHIGVILSRLFVDSY